MNRFICACFTTLLLVGPTYGQYVQDMPYFHQYSNQLDPGGSCQNTCVAMVLKYYGATDITPDKITRRWGTGVAKTVAGLARVLNTEAAERGLGIRDINTERGHIEEVYALLDAGKPVIIHGRFSTAGHLVVLLGYDEHYYYVHDPAGKWRQSNDAGFTNTDNPTIGYYTRYDRAAIERAIISADHRRDVALHALVETERPLDATWHGALPQTIAAGQTLRLDETITLTRFIQDGPAPVLTADLSALGGSPAHPLLAQDGQSYRLEAVFDALPVGRKRLTVHLAQDTLHTILSKRVLVAPLADAPIFTDNWGPNWSQGFTTKVTVAPAQFGGRQVLALDAASFTVEYLPNQPVDPSAYRALRFNFHPGDAVTPRTGAFTLSINNDNRKFLKLINGERAELGIDMENRAWQSVEIPLDAFYPLEEPIESIRLFGNLRGQFYLDEVVLVAKAGPDQSTAVVKTQDDSAPNDFSLDANFPNPFNSSTQIRFALASPAPVELAVYNLAGQKIARLVHGPRAAGTYRIAWDGRDNTGRVLASGVYLYRLTAGNQVQTRKLLLLR